MVGVVYFFLVYRFKDSIIYIINKESNGKYVFDAGDAEISLLNKTVRLRNCVICNTDTLHAAAGYVVSIQEIRLSLVSWKELLFHKKLVLDSLSIGSPAIRLHARKMNPWTDPATGLTKRGEFQVSDIPGYLEKALSHFNVYSFSLQDASFDYTTGENPVPMHGDHISLAVSNFTHVNNEDSHLLGSDKVAIRMGKQHWILPDGRQVIDFNQLTFDSRGQRFELDSFGYFQRAPEAAGGNPPGEIKLRADKFFFNARHLPAIYQKEQLLLDTLVCINPVLSIPGYHGKAGQAGSTGATNHAVVAGRSGVPDSLAHPRFNANLFKFINVKFVAVINGEFLLQNKNGITENSATRKVNMSIFNLSIDPAKDPSINSDSIKVNLKKIEFITRDSLYQLSIDEFAFHRNDALFRNVRFGPIRPDRSEKELVFTAPELLLRDINVLDLLQKRLKASGAELTNPLIVLVDKSPGPVPVASSARTSVFSAPGRKAPGDNRPGQAGAKMALFYRTLHHLSELMDTRDFNIINGTVRYQQGGGAGAFSANAGHVDVHILLNKFFSSDSLVDIKHAIPDLRIGTLLLAANGAHMQVTNTRFDGAARHTREELLQLTTAGGLELTARNVYWNVFDWDIFQDTRDIQIDSMHADELIIHSVPAGQYVPAGQLVPARQPALPGDLPVIRIGRLHIDKISLDSRSAKTNIHLTASDLHAEGLRSAGRFFTWDHAGINLSDIGFTGPGIGVNIASIAFNSNKESQIRDLVVESGGWGITAPLINLQTDLHSTDPTKWTLRSLVADNAALTGAVLTTRAGDPTVKGAGARTTEDTLTGKTSLAVRVRNMNSSGYEDVKIDLANTHLRQGGLRVDMPASALQLSNGLVQRVFRRAGAPVEQAGTETPGALTADGRSSPGAGLASVSTAIRFDWKDAGIVYNKEGMSLAIAGMSGSVADKHFRRTPGMTISLQRLIAATTIDRGDLHWRNRTLRADVNGLSWDPANETFRSGPFNMAPIATMDEDFGTSSWQKDHITFRGRSLTITGVSLTLPEQTSPSANKSKVSSPAAGRASSLRAPAFHIRSLAIDGVTLNAFRDKRMPFRHGIEKPMPTKLINTIPVAIGIDSVLLQEGTVNYNELSVATGKWSTIQVGAINGVILHVGNRDYGRDTLQLSATGQLFGSHIRHFFYQESYGDSLSGFTAGADFSGIDLTRFSEVSIPAAAVSITRGHADTVFSSWAGNKYATYGTMNFYYDHLRIKVLNKNDSSRAGFMHALETGLANLILPGKRKKTSTIFMERDREKFVFNYWVKAQTSGLLSTLGVRSNAKYRKQYQKKARQYSLPAQPSSAPARGPSIFRRIGS